MKINGSLIPLTCTWHSFRAETAGGRYVKSVNQNYELKDTDDMILVFGDITITLPSAADVTQKWYTIKKMDSNTTTVTIVPDNGEQINDSTSAEITTQFSDISIISNGQQWISVGFSDFSLNHLYTKEEIDTAISTDALSVAGNITANTLLVDQSVLAESSKLTSLSVQSSATINTLKAESFAITGSVKLLNESIQISNSTLVSTASSSKTISLPDLSGTVVVIDELCEALHNLSINKQS